MENEKIYFQPGDLVTIRQELPNKPVMLVVQKETRTFKDNNTKEDFLIGIKCRWFTTSGALEEAIFNTKDLVLIKQ